MRHDVPILRNGEVMKRDDCFRAKARSVGMAEKKRTAVRPLLAFQSLAEVTPAGSLALAASRR